MAEERAKFGSKIGVILATAGSAVGLGNVWRFPYMTGENGGAAYIFIYIACVIVLGIPCMIAEFLIGRQHRKSLHTLGKRQQMEVDWLLRSAHRFPHYGLLCRGFGMVFELCLCFHHGRTKGRPQLCQRLFRCFFH